MTIDLASKLEAANAHIAELEALVADQKAATDEEFQNCSKAEAELAEAKAALDARDEQLRMMATDNAAKDARIAGLEAQLRHMHTFDSQHRARIAELEAYHTNCTDYINGLLGNMADDDKERVAILARAEQAEKRVGELEDTGPGTPLGRLIGIADEVIARGLCKGIEIKSAEGFLLEAYDATLARAEQAEAERDAMLAERNGLRALLALAVQWAGLNVPYKAHLPDWVVKARATLAPSTAGREG